MPEGDTLHRAARAVTDAVVGHELTAFEAPRLVGGFPAIGATVDRAEAKGKHLLVWFSDGRVLHTHLRMTGSWRTTPPGGPWPGPRRDLRARIATRNGEAFCLGAPVVRLLDAGRVHRDPQLMSIGPDLCVPPVDRDAIAERLLRVHPDTVIGDVLLDQRIAGGIGNVYRCEVLFRARIHPSRSLGEVGQELAMLMFDDAAMLLQWNLSLPNHTRITVPGLTGSRRDDGLFVHGRGDRPCRVCATPIVLDRAGRDARYRYYCPTCQPR